jgi:hypothetical protein
MHPVTGGSWKNRPCPDQDSALTCKPVPTTLVQQAGREKILTSMQVRAHVHRPSGSGLRSNSLFGGMYSLFDHALDHFRIEIAGSGLLGARGQVAGLRAEPY